MMKVNGGMPERISVNVALPKQTQNQNFGEKVATAAITAGSLLGSNLGGSPIISAAVGAASAITAGYAAAGIVQNMPNMTVGVGTANTANLTAGSGTNGIGQYNTDIAEMSRQNSQMLQVQMAMQRENTMFSSISNVLKTKHDTAKNSIGNIR